MNLSDKNVLRSLLRNVVILLAAQVVVCCSPYATSQESGSQQPLEISDTKSGEVATPDDDEGGAEPPYKPKTEAELKRSLSAIQYKVTQKEGTEQAFRNKYWNNKKEGVYRCVVCAQSLFSSQTKYKSGTGWPSFYDPIKKDHVGYRTDFHLFYPRKEVHCSRCNAHLGHVFDDGPSNKTGKRYCMNSAALTFEPASEKAGTKKAKEKD